MERWKKATLWVLGITTLGGGSVVAANYLGYGPTFRLPESAPATSSTKPPDPLGTRLAAAREAAKTSEAEKKQAEEELKREEEVARLNQTVAANEATKVAIDDLREKLQAGLTATPTSTIPATELEAPSLPTPTFSPSPRPLTTLEARGTQLAGDVIERLADREETRIAQTQPIRTPIPIPVSTPGSVSGRFPEQSDQGDGQITIKIPKELPNIPFDDWRDEIGLFGTALTVYLLRRKIHYIGRIPGAQRLSFVGRIPGAGIARRFPNLPGPAI